MTSDDELVELISGLRSGDQRAASDFCERYGPALLRIADRRLPDAIRRRVGPEDVVQSACRTFLRRARGGEFQLTDSQALWQLLCAITLTKVREQTRFHRRQKRDVGQEVGNVRSLADDTGEGVEPAGSDRDPADAAAIADQFELVLKSLDDEERQFVDLKLQEFTNDEIANSMQCSSRTVTRILKRVRNRLAQSLDSSLP